MTKQVTVDAVGAVIADVLGLEGERRDLAATTSLLGETPELDSMAIVQVVLALEDHFGIEIDGDEITGEVFETVGSLTDFVAAQTS